MRPKSSGIGLLLCKTKNRLVAEYALSGISKPIGVAEYQLVRALPEPLDTNLPSIEEIEASSAARRMNDEAAHRDAARAAGRSDEVGWCQRLRDQPNDGLSLGQMADLFQRDKSVISRHIKNVFEKRELSPTATVAKYATVQREGDRDLSRVRGR